MSRPVEPTRTTIPLASVRLDGGTQMRARLDESRVKKIADALVNTPHSVPPVSVRHDGANYWLSDGFHRVAAHQTLQRTSIDADVTRGDAQDAVIDAACANDDHGMAYSIADKQRAVDALLKNPKCAEWSNAMIADHARVEVTMVRRGRTRMEATRAKPELSTQSSETTITPKPVRTKGKDGKWRENKGQRDAGQRRAGENAVAKIAAAPTQRAAEDAYGKAAAGLRDGKIPGGFADKIAEAYAAKNAELTCVPKPAPEPQKPRIALANITQREEEARIRAYTKLCLEHYQRTRELLADCPLAALRNRELRTECETAMRRLIGAMQHELTSPAEAAE